MQKALSVQQRNVAMAQRVWDEVWHQGNFGVMSELFAPNFVRHDPGGIENRGVKQAEKFMRRLLAAFPDEHYTIDDVIAADDKVVTRYHCQGTHLGDSLGFPATKKKVSYSGILIQRFEDGKIVEQWTEFDQLSLFQQLGVIPKLA
jgi:steroid delta-isomerase-like uncharacterized protein